MVNFISCLIIFTSIFTKERRRRQGVCLLDIDDPTKVVKRPKQSIFRPEEIWELRGDVPNVVFSCANPVVNNIVHFYYAGADHVIGLATCPLDELVEFVLSAP